MKPILFIVLVLIIYVVQGVIIIEEDIQEETTTLQPEEDCITQHGDAGKCVNIQECYPLLDDKEIWNPLLESEILQTSRSEICTSLNETSRTICCKINNGSEEFLSDEEFKEEMKLVEPVTRNSTIFPTNCGKSEVNLRVLWNKKGQKITGGRNAIQGQFPWMVAIFAKNGKLTCGGSLITNEIVLTAAHCLVTYTAKDLKNLKLHLGDFNIMSLRDGPHEVRRISQAIVHKRFDSKTYHNDVALIKMDRPVSFGGNIQPICLPQPNFRNKDVEGKTVIVSGWGRDRAWGYESSILRMVEMPVYTIEECQRIYNYFAPNRIKGNFNLCAGDARKSKDACIGDSGGPASHEIDSRWTQLGITSWGKGCGSFPGVYTSLVNYVQWIEKQVTRLLK